MQIETGEFTSDGSRVAIPRPGAAIAVRFGPMTRTGIDVSALGTRAQVHRKHIRAGMKIVIARLPFEVAESVLGTSAGAIAGRIVPIGELWGDACARELIDDLMAAPDLRCAANLLERAISKRMAASDAIHTKLAIAAADKLVHASVREVAHTLGISERQLRRVFHDTIGLSPKAFARIVRFHRAIDAAKSGASWTRVAAATGYCDQAHLIDEFHAIAGTTPRGFMAELSAR